MKYTSLHHHSTFSYQDGFALPEAHVRRAAELDMHALAMTEHGNVSSHVPLEKAANAQGIKPIFGCELYTGKIEESTRTQRKNHLTVLAADSEGYRNLLQVVSKGWAEGFYYEPTVSGATLAEYSRGLVVLSGCSGGLLATSLTGGKNIAPEDASYARAKRGAARFKRSLGDAYYLEVQAFPSLPEVCTINRALEQIGNELKIPLVATGDVHYTEPNESEMQLVLHTLRGMAGGDRDSLARYERTKLCPPTTDAAMLRKLRETGLSRRAAQQAVINSAEIAERCTVTLPKLDPLRYPAGREAPSSLALWRKWIDEGWYYRRCHTLDPKTRREYRARLKYEMEIIEGKEFIDYFLIISDLVKFAKDNQIPVGPARGSAAASLVCWLLRITEVDPLKFPTLVFERFIDKTRQDLPDVDLDFDGTRRHEIRDYWVAKYGSRQVGNIGTFTNYKAKNSLDDVARVHRIPGYEVDKIKELLIERSSGDLRASATIEDTVEQFDVAADVMRRFPKLKQAYELEGNIKGMGMHAAGLVLANGPLTDVCAVYKREVPKGSGQWVDVISVDKWDAEYLNIMKADVLALDTMSMISQCLGIIDMKLEELYDIPLTDTKTIEGFRRGDVIGIFQFHGRAQRSVNAELKPDTFAEICDICALARPGPLHNGATAEYIQAKRHGSKQRFHPILDPITKHTNYQIVYQEQILRICMEVGNFDWTHAAHIRKIISKKLGEQEFARQFERFWAGAQTHGLTHDEAEKIWSACITAGTYAFNNAHTVGYGMLAFWTMWLKAHHTQAFFAASLATTDPNNKDKVLELLRDAEKHDLRIEPPDVMESDLQWKPEGIKADGLRMGLTQVPGIGLKTAKNIMAWRKDKSTFDVGGWYDLVDIPGIGAKTIDKVIDFCGDPDPLGIHKIERDLANAKQQLRKYKQIPRPTHTGEQVPYTAGKDTQVVWLGKIVHRNQRDLFELHFSRTGEELDPADVRNPELREWVVMRGVDGTEMLSVTVDRFRYNKFREAIWGIKLDSDVVLVRGLKKGNQSRRAIYVSDIWVVTLEDGDEE